MHERKREPNLWTNKIISEKESLCMCMRWRAWLLVMCVLISQTHTHTYIHGSKSSRAFCMHSLYILYVVCTEYTIYLFIFVVLCCCFSPFFFVLPFMLFSFSQWFFIAFRKCSVLFIHFGNVVDAVNALLLMSMSMLMLLVIAMKKMSSQTCCEYTESK